MANPTNPPAPGRPTHVRLAEPDDIATMQTIELEAGALFASIGMHSIAEDPPPEATALQRHIDDGSAWVAAHDGDIVGYLVASIVDGEGHVDQVSVLPAAAGQRIGSRLIDAAIAWTIGHELTSITLTTFTDVPWNGPYYERLGFVAVPPSAMGPELAAIREAERSAGIDVSPRTAMRRPLP